MESEKRQPLRTSRQPHSHVVLFYRYFLPTSKANEDEDPAISGALDTSTLQFFQTYSNHYLTLLQTHQTTLCEKLGMKGRILISTEGINGTLSCHQNELKQYQQEMEAFDLLSEFDPPPSLEEDTPKKGGGRLFTNIDWKISTVQYTHGEDDLKEPFPDLKVQIVKEIVNTGGAIDAKDIPSQSGKEISPEEFHDILMGAKNDDNDSSTKKKEVVLIDVRNTFEHAIGHFVHPHSNTIIPGRENSDITTSISTTNENIESSTLKKNSSPTPAINPNTVTFSHFDSNFCSKYSDVLKDKKVLMYCTGGIRCVKASAMLKKRGVEDVSHLSGGIHRYLEKFADEGFFKGKCMVFDQRVALDPVSLKADSGDKRGSESSSCKSPHIVGKCIECTAPYDQLSGGNLCTVCRDLVLICPACRESKYEYHCDRHRDWKNAYFTFLDGFTIEELQKQSAELQKLHDSYIPPKEHKNVRRTLRKQTEKVLERICKLKDGSAAVESNPRRRCRTCFDLNDICDGLCWGFWKHAQMHRSSELEPIREIKVGQRVRPGPNWNEFRLGSKYTELTSISKKAKPDQQVGASILEGPTLKIGTVVQIKPWSTGADENDCVAVLWDCCSPPVCCSRRKRRKQQVTTEGADDNAMRETAIYRWGAIARNGKRMYDVELA